MTIRFFGTAILMSILSVTFNCSSYKSGDNGQPNVLTRASHSTPSPKENDLPAVIKSVDIYAWWWSSEQLREGFDSQNPPPKKTYIRIDRWEDTTKPSIPHPEQIDVICQVENRGNEPLDLTVLATGDWIVAPYQQDTDKNSNEITDEVAWTEESQIGREVIKNLAPGEIREVKIKDFNLGEAIRNFDGDKSDLLWPWKFRVHIYIEKPSGERIQQEQTVLSLFPNGARKVALDR